FLHLFPDRAGRRGELDGEGDQAVAGLDVLDESQRHDVLVEVRILYCLERGQNLVLHGRRRLTEWRRRVNQVTQANHIPNGTWSKKIPPRRVPSPRGDGGDFTGL